MCIYIYLSIFLFIYMYIYTDVYIYAAVRSESHFQDRDIDLAVQHFAVAAGTFSRKRPLLGQRKGPLIHYLSAERAPDRSPINRTGPW